MAFLAGLICGLVVMYVLASQQMTRHRCTPRHRGPGCETCRCRCHAGANHPSVTTTPPWGNGLEPMSGP